MGEKLTLVSSSPESSPLGYQHRAEAGEGDAARRLLEQHGFVIKHKKSSRQYTCPCPFHEEPGEVPAKKSPNFYLDSVTSRYFCHSATCGERGNLVTLERHFGIDSEAIPEFRTRETQLREFESALLPPERRGPLHRQGLSDITIERFRIGYDPMRECFVIPYLEGRRPYAFRFYDPQCRGPNGSKYWWETGVEARLFNPGDAVGDEKGRVVLCEGELKCMLVVQMGYAGVAVPGASVFKEEWFGTFNGAHQIVICFDNDNPTHHTHGIDCRRCPGACAGHNPGQEAAERLLGKFSWRAKNVVLPLPNESVRKTDLNEYVVRDGHTIDELAEILFGDKRRPFQVQTFAEILENPPDETVFLVENGILPQAGRLLIAGKPKSGKSILTENLVLSLAAGIPFLGRFQVDHPTRVLLLDRELSRRSLFERLMMLLQYRPGYRVAAPNLCIDHDHLIKFDQDGAYEGLVELVRQNGVEVVVFDTAYKFFFRDMDSASSLAKAWDVLDRLIHETGCSVILTHHHKKGQGNSDDGRDPDNVAGSFLWTGWPNATIQLTFLNRSVQDPFNTVCSFTAFRDAPPPEPVVLYRNRESIAYQAITDHLPGEVGRREERASDVHLNTANLMDLLLEHAPIAEEEFYMKACQFFHVTYKTVRPYLIDALNTPHFTKTENQPYILKYLGDVEEESWDQDQPTLIPGTERERDDTDNVRWLRPRTDKRDRD